MKEEEEEEEDARPHARLVDVGIGQGRARHPRRKEVESFIPSRELPIDPARQRPTEGGDAVDRQTSQDSSELKWTPSWRVKEETQRLSERRSCERRHCEGIHAAAIGRVISIDTEGALTMERLPTALILLLAVGLHQVTSGE